MARNKYPEVTVRRILDTATELFLTKGCEDTTIQDIINDLGDLSKGAIYHHFKSKEEIINGVMNSIYGNVESMYDDIMKSTELNGLEKLKKLFQASVGNANQKLVVQVVPNFLKNPKLLAKQVDASINEVAPEIIEPIIREGIEDGSIQTEYPKELAEVLLLLANIWLNPLIFASTPEEIHRKCQFFREMTKGLNIELLDDELMNRIEKLGSRVQAKG